MTKENLIGSSLQFKTVVEEVNMVAPIDCFVLIQGETGTGKELIAKAIHDASPRSNRPFIALNCAAIPSALLESELFGHEKGAFTGAVSQTSGKFLAAHGGTLFLDEIGDLPLELQPKLLRVLQEKQFERLGSTHATRVDVRVIAATNLNLQRMVEEKIFRADLYYRLNVFSLHLPALHEREGDIELLVKHFVQKFSVCFGKKIDYIPDEVMDILTRHHWPGNIRELQNFIERSVIMTADNVLTPRLTELAQMAKPVSTRNDHVTTTSQTLSDAERAHITSTLSETDWVIGGRDGAATRLGLPRTTLISRMRKLGISRTSDETSGLSIRHRIFT